jgi:DNA-binding transcriptional MocR family regulator
MAAGDGNLKEIRRYRSFQTIGPDKLNQLRHLSFLGDIDGVRSHMKKHRALIEPKFAAVAKILEAELGGTNTAEWTSPKGGYFVSVNVKKGCAKRVVELCRQAGVTLTGAGASFPYGKDPEDSNIRIAPTFPPVGELEQAMELFCICVRLAAAEKLLGERAAGG